MRTRAASELYFLDILSNCGKVVEVVVEAEGHASDRRVSQPTQTDKAMHESEEGARQGQAARLEPKWLRMLLLLLLMLLMLLLFLFFVCLLFDLVS